MLCVIAILAVKDFGNAQPNFLAEWFTNVDGSSCRQTCLFGIEPGITKYGEALKIISEHPETHTMQIYQRLGYPTDANNITYGNGLFCVSIWQDQGDKVGGIIVSTQACYVKAPQGMELGQLMALLGNPDGISLGKYGVAPDYYFFLDGKLYLQAWNENNSCNLSPTTNYDLLELDSQDGRDPSLPEWKGFAKRTKYALTPNEQIYLSNCGR